MDKDLSYESTNTAWAARSAPPWNRPRLRWSARRRRAHTGGHESGQNHERRRAGPGERWRSGLEGNSLRRGAGGPVAFHAAAEAQAMERCCRRHGVWRPRHPNGAANLRLASHRFRRAEEHTSELQSVRHRVCRLLLEKKKHIIKLSLLCCHCGAMLAQSAVFMVA